MADLSVRPSAPPSRLPWALHHGAGLADRDAARASVSPLPSAAPGAVRVSSVRPSVLCAAPVSARGGAPASAVRLSAPHEGLAFAVRPSAQDEARASSVPLSVQAE